MPFPKGRDEQRWVHPGGRLFQGEWRRTWRLAEADDDRVLVMPVTVLAAA